jgi:lysyl-tRNA synthetase class II
VSGLPTQRVRRGAGDLVRWPPCDLSAGGHCGPLIGVMLASGTKAQTIARARQSIRWSIIINFLEVETPMLHVIPGGALARPFTTHHNKLDMPLYLRVAPELHLKRLIIGGLAEKLFEINRCFRNEGLSPRHNPEFTSLELYQAYVDFTSMIDLTEAIVYEVAMRLHGMPKVKFTDIELNFTPPWPRKGMVDLVREHTGLEPRPRRATRRTP